jgi:uncharacterized membrane protein YbjE (DUF340 family)
MDISNLRKYRITLQPLAFNSNNEGIALFDLISTFLVGFILESYIRSYIKISKLAYYLLLLPIGVIVHLLTNQDTFLNKQLFNNSVNIYKIIMIVIVYKLYKELSIN